MRRKISLFIRYLQSFKDRKKLLLTFSNWQLQQQHLPGNKLSEKKLLLIIRLDDIGDYILCRNSLYLYKQSPEYKDYSIHLLGNIAWKDLFETFDAATVDAASWIKKAAYFNDEAYRLSIWKQLRANGYSTVICPSHTRPLLLDDLCMLATGAPIRIASKNTYKYPEWNNFSDSFYTNLFQPTALIHEFYFNEQFASWCTGVPSALLRPFLNVSISPTSDNNFILCFIGANTKSKQWPAAQWIEFIKMIRDNYGYKVVIAGGSQEAAMAKQIEEKATVHNIVNQVSLSKLANWIAASDIIISNDTMAAHLAVACNRPLIIISKGDNFYRFTAYKKTGIENVITIYAPAFLHKWKKKNYQPFQHYIAITKDISMIKATIVFNAFKELATQNGINEKNTGR